ncbi:hypothetical protein XENOCAPTIV_016466 [Xenoophorus captivus]|uniref:Uncharacterized protein n=1 Tax=Xenoophorus captivus TaxID=1517983 RepID=A0ABV0R527_9TELE
MVSLCQYSSVHMFNATQSHCFHPVHAPYILYCTVYPLLENTVCHAKPIAVLLKPSQPQSMPVSCRAVMPLLSFFWPFCFLLNLFFNSPFCSCLFALGSNVKNHTTDNKHEGKHRT